MKTSDKIVQFHFYLQTLISHHVYLYSANIYFWRIDDHAEYGGMRKLWHKNELWASYTQVTQRQTLLKTWKWAPHCLKTAETGMLG